MLPPLLVGAGAQRCWGDIGAGVMSSSTVAQATAGCAFCRPRFSVCAALVTSLASQSRPAAVLCATAAAHPPTHLPFFAPQVPETLPAEILAKIGAPAKADDPIITADELKEYDGFLFGERCLLFQRHHVLSAMSCAWKHAATLRPPRCAEPCSAASLTPPALSHLFPSLPAPQASPPASA